MIYAYCPYCGSLQTEEKELFQLLQSEVYMLHCRACDGDCVMVLYDGIRGSEQSASEET